MEVIKQRGCGIYALRLMKNGILQIHTSEKREPNVEELQKCVQIIGEMIDYKKSPILFTRDDLALSNHTVRAFWAKKASFPYASAEAFMMHSIALAFIANFYLKINKPERPTKMFKDKNKAIEWLKTFL